MNKAIGVAGLAVVLGVGAGLTGCRGQRASITVAGSTAFQPFAEKLAEQYMAAHPKVNITVQGGGSALGIQSALSGAAQIGMADLVQLPPEARALNSVVVARDGIAVVFNKANPVGNLTLAQVRSLFNGRARNWREVGGDNRSVTVVSREAGSGTRSSFEQIVGGIELSPDAIIQDSNGAVRETVANDPQSVGYLSHGVVNDRIRASTIDGSPCTIEEIAAGRYKLVRPVYFLTRGEPSGLAAEFIDFVLSAEGQAAIKADGLLPAK